MGFFSWKTQDTKRSIANQHSEIDAFPVTMTDNNGRQWVETDYDGYGVFGGKDFYELLAEMNGASTRDEGIKIAFGSGAYLSPNLNENQDLPWTNSEPESCEFQGFFYENED